MIFGVVRPKEGVLIPFAKFPLVYAALILLGIMCCNIHALRKDSLAFKLLGLLGAYFWVTGGILSFWHLVASQDLSGETVTYPVLLCLLPIWAGDIAAIYAGTRWGKHPMMPSLSPNKTWEGGGANLLSCAILSAITGWVISAPLWISLSCGLTCGVVGQAGDLFESLLKRTAGVKDSGNLLPGHGGILDRIDSLLFAGAGVAALLAVIQ